MMTSLTTINITGPGAEICGGQQPAVELSGPWKPRMPLIGLGTWKSQPDQVRDAVLTAVRSGYRHVDLAAGYKNEHKVGEALHILFDNGEIRREDLFITSKLFMTHCTPEDYEEMLNQTLSDCGINYLDLYLVHLPYFLRKDAKMPPDPTDCKGYNREEFKALWRELEKEVDKGRLRSIGVSNMSIRKLTNLLEDCRMKPANNQIELHPYLQQKGLVQFCQERGISVTAFSPLGSPDRPNAGEDIYGMQPLLENEIIKKVARKHACSPAQALLKWSISRGIAVVPKSVTDSRIQENIEALQIQLSQDDLGEIDSLDAHIRFLKMDKFIPDGEHWKQLWDEA